jgi:hypothetical protein
MSKNGLVVIPVKVGIQCFQNALDPGVHRGDEMDIFYESINYSVPKKNIQISIF